MKNASHPPTAPPPPRAPSPPEPNGATNLDEQESLDTLFQGAVRVRQRVHGNRFGLDTVLLAGALRIQEGVRVLDLGSGNGALALAIWHLYRPRHILGVEIQQQLVALANRNIRENQLDAWIRMVQGDVRRPEEVVEAQSFDAVVCNPPYYPAESGRLNPDQERAAARHELFGSIRDLLQGARYALVDGGKLVTLLPAFRLPDLLQAVQDARLAPRWIQSVHPRPDQAASLVILEARKGGSPRLVIRPPLSIRIGEEYSATIRCLLAGIRPIYPGEDLSP